MTSGINLVAKFKAQAKQEGKSIFIGNRWLNGVVVGYGIWLYKPGQPTKSEPPVASSIGLDELYGR